MSAEIERAVTARRNALCDPGTGAKILSPFVFLADPHDPSGFCFSKRKLQPLSKLLRISRSEKFPTAKILLKFLSDKSSSVEANELRAKLSVHEANRILFMKKFLMK